MHELEHRITPKIALIGLGVLGLILAILLVFSLRGSRASKSITDKTVVNPPPNSEVTPNADDPITPTPILSLYKDDVISVDYPDDWKVEKEVLQGNTGAIIIFTPIANGPRTYDPSYSVSYDTSSIPLAQRMAIPLALGFTQDAVRTHAIPFVRLRGVTPNKIVAGEVVESPVHETDLYGNINARTILIKYLYGGAQRDINQEKEFLDLIEKTTFVTSNQ
jgi:hypothetical protein